MDDDVGSCKVIAPPGQAQRWHGLTTSAQLKQSNYPVGSFAAPATDFTAGSQGHSPLQAVVSEGCCGLYPWRVIPASSVTDCRAGSGFDTAEKQSRELDYLVPTRRPLYRLLVTEQRPVPEPCSTGIVLRGGWAVCRPLP